jgi:glutathione S-transferase
MPTKPPTRRPSRRMKVTTVRFGEDLWALLEAEADHAGVSVSQYIREAALARAAFLVGARAGVADELLAAWSRTLVSGGHDSPEHDAATQRLIAALARSEFRRGRDEAAAVRGESRQARRQAKTVRKQRPRRSTD